MKPTPLSRIVPLLLTLTAAVVPLRAADAEPTATQTHTSSTNVEDAAQIRGLWVWKSEWFRTAEARAELLNFCRDHGLNRLLVQVHLDPGHTEPTLEFPEAFKALAIEAAEAGIAMEALDGAKDMAVAANQPRTKQILERILEVNAQLPDAAKLKGVHYDIEPYLMPEWKADDASRQTIMRDLLTFYTWARQRLEQDGSGMLLSADIPFWYDSKNAPGDNCVITFNDQTKNLHQHIQDICDYVGIMSYRRSAVGRNSVTSVIQEELEYAESIGKQVTPALETVELKDVPQITFFGTSPQQLWEQYNLVVETLEDRPGFGGILLHCYRGLRDLHGMAPVASTGTESSH